MTKIIRRGDIFWIELKDRSNGDVLSFRHPGIVIQTNEANLESSVTIVAGVTTYKGGRLLPWEIVVDDDRCGLPNCFKGKPCKIACNMIFTVDINTEIKGHIGRLTPRDMYLVDEALNRVLDLK